MSTRTMVVGVLLASVAWAAGTTVETAGEAKAGGDLAAAKREALQVALRRAVEQAVGVELESAFSAEQKETVKQNQATFESAVRDRLVQRSEGFIERYDVLEEKVADGLVRVKVRATVHASKLAKELAELTGLIRAAGNPKLLLAVQELRVGVDGVTRVSAESVVGLHLEKELAARGFVLQGTRTAGGSTPEAHAAWVGDAAAIAARGRAEGAQLVLAGTVWVRELGAVTDTAGFEALQGQMRLEVEANLRGVNATTGELVSADPVKVPSVGANVSRAVDRALKGKGQSVVQQLLDGVLGNLKATLLRAAEAGQTFVLEVSGIKSFRKQGEPFVKLVKGVEGATAVEQRGFTGGTLTVELSFKGTAADLQARLFAAVAAVPELATLDVTGQSGNRLSLGL